MNRDELEEQLRPLVFSCPGQERDGCPFSGCTHCDDRMAHVMALVDQYAASQQEGMELWPSDKVAQFLGLVDHNQARTVMSRARIPGVSGKHPVTGKRAALYSANQVRALKVKRDQWKDKRKGPRS